MPAKKYIIEPNQRFGRLVTIERICLSVKYRTYGWSCLCDCGNHTTTRPDVLVKGISQSCGCLQRERAALAATRHGQHGSPTYKAWGNMIQRTTNPRMSEYDRYGGRGITVCDEWLIFENFLRDMGPRPLGKYSIDRMNNDGNYEPTNCRWATRPEQDNNTSRSLLYTINEETLSLKQWAYRFQIHPDTLYARVIRMGWDFRLAITVPVRPTGR